MVRGARQVSRERQEEEMVARWKKDYFDTEADVFVFPPENLLFNVFFDEDETVVFGAVPAEYFQLTGHMFDQSFLIKGLDEETWFETMESFWETDVHTTLDAAREELEDLGLRHSQRIANPFEEEGDDDDEGDYDDDDSDGSDLMEALDD